ncbi:MAG: PDZ domain-containing protein [Deltaproteobacteria bacterium]|nr:PDZ domain-containing protein [Deltaproteobacteria bacterium]
MTHHPGEAPARTPACRRHPRRSVRVLRGRGVTGVAIASALAVLVIAGPGGCGTNPAPAMLLDVDEVTPAVVEPGSVLRIAGDGFPVARDAMVVLVGQLARPGNAPLDVNHTLRGHARSEQLIEVQLGEPDLTALGGRGTFTGSLHITFSGIASRRDVAGSVDGVEFDLRLSADGGLHEALERGERAEAALDELGITPADEQSPSGGLRIGEVRPDSAAARATLTAGDVLVRFDGVRVLELGDLAPRPGVLRVTLEVERPGTSQPTTLEMPLRGPPEGQKGRVLLMLVLLGALVVFVASVPATSGPLTLFVRDAVDVKAPHAIDWLLGYAPGTRVGTPRKQLWLSRGLALLAVSGAFAGMAVAGRVFDRLFDTGALTGLALMLRLSIQVFGLRTYGRPERWLTSAFVLRGAPMALSVVAVLLLGGTNHLRGLQVAQGGALWDFMVFRHPIAFLLFPVFAVAALGGPSATISDPRTPVFVAAAARAHLLVVAGLGTVVFLGGWHPITLGGAVPELGAAVLGVLVFVLKCWGLMLLGLRLRIQSGAIGERPPTFLLPAAVLGLVASCAWIALGVPADVETLSGPVLLATSALVVGITLFRRHQAGSGTEVHLHPFL